MCINLTSQVIASYITIDQTAIEVVWQYISIKKLNFKLREDLTVHIPSVFESMFVEINSDNFKAIVGEIYRVPNTNEINSINMYEDIIRKLQNYKNEIIIGTDQNFDYIKLDQHKNTQKLLDIFLTNGLLPTITKPTRITHTTATLIDNIYISTKYKRHIQSSILTVDISDHLPVITNVGYSKQVHTKTHKTIKTRKITDTIMTKISNTIIGTDWHYLEQMDINEAYENFQLH